MRRMHIREKCSIGEIARRLNLSRNTVRQRLKSVEMGEPKYPERCVVSVVHPYVVFGPFSCCSADFERTNPVNADHLVANQHQ